MSDMNIQEYGNFINEVKQRIYNSQYEALRTVNKALITLGYTLY